MIDSERGGRSANRTSHTQTRQESAGRSWFAPLVGALLFLLPVGCDHRYLFYATDGGATDSAAPAPVDLAAPDDETPKDLAIAAADLATIPDFAWHCLVPCVAGKHFCFWSACSPGAATCTPIPNDCLPQSPYTCACLQRHMPGASKCGEANGMIALDCACADAGCR